MRFFIFFLDSFIITVIANGIVEWKHQFNSKKGYYQILYTCGIWVLFIYTLQYVNLYLPEGIKYIMALPVLIAVVFGKPYLKNRIK